MTIRDDERLHCNLTPTPGTIATVRYLVRSSETLPYA